MMDEETKKELRASVDAITRMCDLFEEVLPSLTRADINYLLDRFASDWKKYQAEKSKSAADTLPPAGGKA